jgi:ubiquinone/menaquinone biosynthesis C-methylase UbiE
MSTTSSARRTDHYVLGHTPDEYERLRSQARMWEPDTVRLFDRVGLGEADRCLDVGCGPGETMRLMAERVGPAGEVVGVDADATIGNQAVETLHAAGHTQCRFEPADLEADATAISGAPFDLVYARLLLSHVNDPAAVLGRLWEWVAPGGHLIVQDYDLQSSAVVPELDSTEEFYRVATEVFRRAGRDIRVGLRLPALHMTAGLGAPDGMETAVRSAPLGELAPMYEAVYRSLLPAALAFGLTTETDAQLWFETFARDSAGNGGHVALWPPMIGTWKHKSAKT